MMHPLVPRALATGVGSLPHRSAHEAWRVVLRDTPTVPFWPQLPNRSFLENMYVQFSEGMSGVKLDAESEQLGLVADDTILAQVEAFYARYLEDGPDAFAVRPEYAAGLYALRDARGELSAARWVKGQITGPISFGLKVVDQNLRPMLYDDTLRDVLVKLLARKAQWMERFLSEFGSPLVFVDEPMLALIGASVVALNREEVMRDLEEVFSALHGLKGAHCCGNTDWSLLLQTSVDVISFDAYSYAENLALFASDVKAFLDRGGAIAWGIVPTAEEEIVRATEQDLVARLDAAVDLLVKKGIDRDLLYERAFVTPSCGLGTVSLAAAERALQLTRGVSLCVRKREWDAGA